MSLPEITTSRLQLRPYQPEDLDDLHRLWTNPELRRYLWDDEVITRERARSTMNSSIATFASDGVGQWLVFLREPTTAIGFCGFRFSEDTGEVELLYGLAPEYWGRGLATEAARAVLRYGFEELGLVRVLAATDAPNEASLRVMKRIGMQFEKRAVVDNRDIIFYSISAQHFTLDASSYCVQYR